MVASIIYLVPTAGSRAVAPSPSAAFPEPALLLSVAVATPIPALPDPASPSPAPSPSPAINVAYAPAVVPTAAQAAPAADSQQALAEMAPYEAPLRRDEAREVQARLRSFGFNPGPVVGDPGGHDGRRHQAVPAEQTPTADRQGRPRIVGAAPPRSCAQDCPADRRSLRSPDPFARTAPSQSIRIRAGRGRSPRPVAGITATLRLRHGARERHLVRRYQQPPFWE